MIKNEKRTAKQEKKFIKQLKRLGFKEEEGLGQYFLHKKSKVFGYWMSDRNKSDQGDLYFYFENECGSGSTDLAKYPTIAQVLALIKEHTGEDLSHKLKSKYEKLEDRVKALEERLEPVIMEVTQETIQAGFEVEPKEYITKMDSPINKESVVPKEETYEFGDVVEVVDDGNLEVIEKGQKFTYIIEEKSNIWPILLICKERNMAIWVKLSQIKKV